MNQYFVIIKPAAGVSTGKRFLFAGAPNGKLGVIVAWAIFSKCIPGRRETCPTNRQFIK
jgi:hypothetical protein